MSAHLNVLIATGKIVLQRVINVKRDYRMTSPVAHNWAFAPRFRRHAFGWRPQPAVRIIAGAPVDDETRDPWLERLWEAHQNDEIPYIERLADYWSDLCASCERGSVPADRLIGTVESAWSAGQMPGVCFHGAVVCLRARFHAGRHEELLALLERAPYSMRHYRQSSAKVLTAMGRKAEALHYAEASRGLNDNPRGGRVLELTSFIHHVSGHESGPTRGAGLTISGHYEDISPTRLALSSVNE